MMTDPKELQAARERLAKDAKYFTIEPDTCILSDKWSERLGRDITEGKTND